ncbi:MAG: TlpA disulfide reductase family protein [Flavobacteriaceae bacterium]
MKKLLIVTFLAFSVQTFSQDLLPNVNITSLEGNTLSLQEATKSDGPVVISLWATWCVPCLKELDAISEVYEDWQAETNVSLFAVSVDDSRTVKRVKPLINGKGWDYTILLDTNNDVKRALGAATVPLTLLVKDGKVVYRHSGYSPGAENELYKKIKEFSK